MATSSSGAAIVPAIEKLNGMGNYGSWKFMVKMILIQEDLWECVESNDGVKPICDDKKKQQRALARICLSINPVAITHVRNATTAREAWVSLQTAYEDRGLCRRLGLMRQLFGMKLQEYSDMESYLTKICDVAQQLTDIEAPLNDEFLAVIMLSGLTTDYDPLIMALENCSVKLSSELVKQKLLQEHQRRANGTYTSVGSVMVTKKRDEKPVKCYRCKRLGHISKNCPGNRKSKGPVAKEMTSMLSALSVDVQKDTWYVDSGSSSHFCNQRDILDDFVPDTSLKVTVANGERLCSAGRGSTELHVKDGIKTLCNVVNIPNLSCNLISVSVLASKGFKIVFISDVCNIYFGNVLFAIAKCENGLYKLETVPITRNSTNSKPRSSESASAEHVAANVRTGRVISQDVWHLRLGHLNSRSMNLLKSGMANGIDFNNSEFKQCISCIEGKTPKLPFPKKSFTRASEVLGLIHTDVCGPMPQTSYGGSRYMLLFIDDFSRKTFSYFIKTKDEVFDMFKEFKALVENQTNKTIKILRSDRGGEFVNKKFDAFLKQHGIRHQLTVPHCPQQNSVVERANRTIAEAARCMLQGAGLDQKYWAEAMNTAVYLKNRSPTKAVLGATPEEKWSGLKVNLNHLRIFGCVAYSVVEDRKKLDPKCKPYLFVGYCENTKGYRLIDPANPSKCIFSRNVVFVEDKFYKNPVLQPVVNEPTPYMVIEYTNESENVGVQMAERVDVTEESEPVSENQDTDDTENKETSTSDEEYAPGSSSWDSEESRGRSDFEEAFCSVFTIASCGAETPTTVREALDGPESAKWKGAMQDEYQSFLDNKCLELVDLPKGKKPVKCKWIFKKKRGLNGELLQYKARLVAKGFTQKYGVDYFETFSPVVRYSTIRLLFALAAEYDMEVDHMDVKTAFLNGDLKEEVYMEIPKGFGVESGKGKAFRLLKAVYGLKQASRSWNEKINDVLVKKLKFKRLASEPCVYVRSNNNGLVILGLYVDDILIFSNNQTEKRAVKEEMMKQFVMKDLGPAKCVLGIHVSRKDGKIILDQSGYVSKVLERFKMTDCKPAKTPMEVGLKLEKAEKTGDYEYRNLIGCLMYIAVCTRPDIAHAVSMLSQFNDCYSEAHWKAAKRVLRYLKGTMDYSIKYEKSGLNVTGSADADWAACVVDRRSYTGYVFRLGNSLVSWESRKQRTIALSSTESEYMSLSDACKEALFIRAFLSECLKLDVKVVVYNDNQSAIKLSENHMFHARTKHIDVRHHFIREVVENGVIVIKYMRTDDILADALTKPLCIERFQRFVRDFYMLSA